MSPSIDKLAPALVRLQASMSAIERTADNPFYQSRYATLDDVWEKLRGPLAENGLAITQWITDAARDGCMGLTTLVLHESGEWMSATAVAPLAKPDPQGVCSARTYLARYGLQGVAGMPTADDDDGNAASAPAQARPAPRPAPARPAKPAPAPAAAAPKPAPRPAPKPDDDDADEYLDASVRKVFVDEKEGARGPYTVYSVILEDGSKAGFRCSTFSDTLGVLAQDAEASKAVVRCGLKRKGKFVNLASIEVIEADGGAGAWAADADEAYE